MTLDKIKKRIESLLSSEKRWPVIVDFSNKNDLKDFLYHFDVGNNTFFSAGELCGEYGSVKLEELSNLVENNEGNFFLVHLSAYLKLYGENELKNTLKSIISKSINGHVIIVTYQCRKYLEFSDSRFYERGQILIAEDEFDENPDICMVSPDLKDAFEKVYDGFNKIGYAYETSTEKILYVATGVDKSLFELSLIHVDKLNNGYDILCSKDSRIKNVPESFGEPSRWNGLLKDMGSADLSQVVAYEFESETNLFECIKEYPNYPDSKKWLYFIAISVFGSKKNSYLSYAVANTINYKDIPRALFRSILTVDRKDKMFSKYYDERRTILKSFSKYLNEIVDFCKLVSSKQEEAIYYLTDLTRPEKEKVFDWLSIYGNKYTTEELVNILAKVFPDLAAYLSKYRFKNTLLDEYFEKYKYQKVVNKILPSFEVKVEEQAIELGFVSALKPRTQIFDKINLSKAHTYFVDAMGVEYLGYIESKCNEYGLSANITCGRCELPSLTSFNKDFVETCNNKGCQVSDIKELDDIKHHGKESFDYEKTKTPIHLIRELEIIDELLQKIQASLLNGQYEKEIIVSDHGASRLAVLHETENVWEMETKGIHSGRCCPRNEINTKPDFAIEESGFWVLCNYDRFKGSRKANVEVHGGATLEEVTVPIVEITLKREGIEAFILDDYKSIVLEPKEIPVIRVYVGIISNNIAVKINGKYYDAKQLNDKYVYEVELPECAKKGIYQADIFNGSDVLSINNKFEVSKKGMTEVSLFD